jgi:hypothetical protein
LAIGLFSEVGALISALEEFASLGVTPQCLCVLASIETLASATWQRASEAAARAFQSIFEEVVAAGHIVDGGPEITGVCMASAGPLHDELCSILVSPSCGRDGATSDWLSQSQRRRMGAHVVEGGLVLVVSSDTPSEQDQSCRILLRHSQHGVQSHDFTMKRSAKSRNGGPSDNHGHGTSAPA